MSWRNSDTPLGPPPIRRLPLEEASPAHEVTSPVGNGVASPSGFTAARRSIGAPQFSIRRMEIDDVSVSYADREAVRSVSMPVRQGEVLSLIGPTALRRRVTMVFQQPNPFPMSVFDNIAYVLREQARGGRAARGHCRAVPARRSRRRSRRRRLPLGLGAEDPRLTRLQGRRPADRHLLGRQPTRPRDGAASRTPAHRGAAAVAAADPRSDGQRRLRSVFAAALQRGSLRARSARPRRGGRDEVLRRDAAENGRGRLGGVAPERL